VHKLEVSTGAYSQGSFGANATGEEVQWMSRTENNLDLKLKLLISKPMFPLILFCCARIGLLCEQ